MPALGSKAELLLWRNLGLSQTHSEPPPKSAKRVSSVAEILRSTVGEFRNHLAY